MGDFLNQGLMEYLDDTHADGNAVTDHQQRLDRFEQALENVLASASPLVNIDEGAALRVHPSNSSEARSFTRQARLLCLALPGNKKRDPSGSARKNQGLSILWHVLRSLSMTTLRRDAPLRVCAVSISADFYRDWIGVSVFD